jgi:hypothetical protein
MAMSRPVLLIGPRPSHAADIIERHEIGWRIDHGDIDGLAALLGRISALPPTELAAMGQRARQAAQQHYSKGRLCADFCDIVERGIKPLERGEPARSHLAQAESLRQSAPWKA